MVPCPSTDPRAARLARELGVPVAFDVNLREHLWLGLEEAREAVEPLLNLSIIVKLGDDELEPLLDTANTQEAAERLLGRGISLVLISLGERGSYYATGGFSGCVPAFEVEAVDTTGAGDAFLAAALAYLSDDPAGPYEEERVREATHRGSAAGALACTDYGAMRALPTKDELERLPGWPEVESGCQPWRAKMLCIRGITSNAAASTRCVRWYGANKYRKTPGVTSSKKTVHGLREGDSCARFKATTSRCLFCLPRSKKRVAYLPTRYLHR